MGNCGSSSSSGRGSSPVDQLSPPPPPPRHHHPVSESSTSSSESSTHASGGSVCCTDVSSSLYDSEPARTESESSDTNIQTTAVKVGPERGAKGDKSSLPKYKESIIHHVSSNCIAKAGYPEKNADAASTSHEEQSLDMVTENGESGCAELVEANRSMEEDTPLISSQGTVTSNLENHADLSLGTTSNVRSLLVLSDSIVSLRVLRNNTAFLERPPVSDEPSFAELLFSDYEQEMRTDGLSHVDVLSISSNNYGSRTNSGVLVWDSISRQTRRRHNDSPTIAITAGIADDIGSRGGWLLDISGDIHFDGHGLGRGFGYSSGRSTRLSERRRHLRSEMSERIQGVRDERDRRTICCPSGLHPDGTCSCNSSAVAEEPPLGRLSHLVLLAEALFEQALDEIHHQPLDLSVLSHPAPESIVDSFPVKNHNKMIASENGPNYVQQCYICLADYEEGDQVRVLPCQHEYHMSCVDKWLKEINGVCPVCRCNVCEITTQGLDSSAELPFG